MKGKKCGSSRRGHHWLKQKMDAGDGGPSVGNLFDYDIYMDLSKPQEYLHI